MNLTRPSIRIAHDSTHIKSKVKHHPCTVKQDIVYLTLLTTWEGVESLHPVDVRVKEGVTGLQWLKGVGVDKYAVVGPGVHRRLQLEGVDIDESFGYVYALVTPFLERFHFRIPIPEGADPSQWCKGNLSGGPE